MLILTGCSKSETDFNDNAKEKETHGKEKVVLSLAEETLTTTGAEFVLVNLGEDTIVFGQECVVEKEEGSVWRALSVLDENTVIYLDSFELEPLSKARFSQNWSSLYGSLGEGKYRIGKDYKKGRIFSFTVYCEFEISQDTKQGEVEDDMILGFNL